MDEIAIRFISIQLTCWGIWRMKQRLVIIQIQGLSFIPWTLWGVTCTNISSRSHPWQCSRNKWKVLGLNYNESILFCFISPWPMDLFWSEEYVVPHSFADDTSREEGFDMNYVTKTLVIRVHLTSVVTLLSNKNLYWRIWLSDFIYWN